MSQRLQQPARSLPQTRRVLQQLKVVFASLPDAIVVWDCDGMLIHLNAAALTLFEIPPGRSWLGTSARQFFQSYQWYDEQHQLTLFAPRGLDFTALDEEVLSRPQEQILILGLLSGRRVYLEIHCSPVLDTQQQPIGMVSVFHEVSPSFQQALHLQRVYQAVTTLNETIAAIPEQPVFAPSPQHFLFSPPVLFVAQQLVDVIRQVLLCWRVSLIAFDSPTPQYSFVLGSGFTPEQERQRREIAGRFQLTDLISKKDWKRLKANQEVIISTDRLRIPAGFPKPVSIATLLMIPLFLQQDLAGVLLVYKYGWDRDYSQEEIELVRAVAEQALLFMDGLNSLQQHMGEQARSLVLQEVHRLSSDFLMLASHELRTPLTGIKGNLQLAQHRLDRLKHQVPEQPEHVSERIEQAQKPLASATQGARLQERMIQDMIDDARIQAHQLHVTLRSCNVLALLKAVVAEQQQANPEHPIKLEILTPESAIPILADTERIIQVLNIYLTNAISASPAGRPVTIRVQEEGDLVRISVHDEGPGLSSEEQQHLWDRFYRGKGSSVQHELDLSQGLRFYLCQALIELHHGTTGVHSAPGCGATFWFTLPMASS